MKFPEKFIKHGKFKLHSGKLSDTLYDINEMLTDPSYLATIINNIPDGCKTYVGIATGGALIAICNRFFADFAMIKDGELKGEVDNNYCLIDDVCTTENSLQEAIKIIGKKPKIIFVVVDRRKNKMLKIDSMYKVS